MQWLMYSGPVKDLDAKKKWGGRSPVKAFKRAEIVEETEFDSTLKSMMQDGEPCVVIRLDLSDPHKLALLTANGMFR